MDLMKTLTDLLAPLVTPDWGALVGLIPGILAIFFVVWFALTLRAFATAGPTRRAPARIEALTPPELHMPGPSAAPILVAVGAAALFGGLVHAVLVAVHLSVCRSNAAWRCSRRRGVRVRR